MASQVGVRQGDIIVSVNGSDIASVEDFNNAVDSADLSAGVRMRVYRDGGTRFVFMKSNK
jgi:S1-C subfamily serine protease